MCVCIKHVDCSKGYYEKRESLIICCYASKWERLKAIQIVTELKHTQRTSWSVVVKFIYLLFRLSQQCNFGVIHDAEWIKLYLFTQRRIHFKCNESNRINWKNSIRLFIGIPGTEPNTNGSSFNSVLITWSIQTVDQNNIPGHCGQYALYAWCLQIGDFNSSVWVPVNGECITCMFEWIQVNDSKHCFYRWPNLHAYVWFEEEPTV